MLGARDLIEGKALSLRWVPTTHQLADVLTKLIQSSEVMQRFLLNQKYGLIPTLEEEQEEARRQELRKGQRERRKERKKT